jgi:hypothetical protein
MMILASQGKPFLDQSDLAQLRQLNPVTPFSTAPEDVKTALNHHWFQGRFGVRERSDQREAVRDIVFALATARVPAATLAFSGFHWTTVAAVQTDVPPVPGQSYNVQRIYFNSPQSTGHPPHSDQDGCVHNLWHGVKASDVIPYEKWCEDFVSAPAGGPRYISVLAHQEPNQEPNIEKPNPVPGLALAQAGPSAAGVLTQEAMERMSQEALIGIRLSSESEESAWERMQHAQAGPAVRVERLDEPGSPYFLLPWKIGGELIATTQIDATGRFESVHFHSGSWYNDLPVPEAEPTLQRLAALGLDVGAASADRPSLVWRPCQQSFSPHFPFLRVGARLRQPEGPTAAAAGSPQTFFVRLDGTRFQGLTTS